MKADYLCKFCGLPGSVTVGDDPVEVEAADRWFPMLCCDRCGHFREDMRKVRRSLMSLAIKFSDPEKKTPKPVLEQLRDAIIVATKKVTTLVCDYYHVTNIWSIDFAQQIFEKPNQVDVIIGRYIHGVSKISKSL